MTLFSVARSAFLKLFISPFIYLPVCILSPFVKPCVTYSINNYLFFELYIDNYILSLGEGNGKPLQLCCLDKSHGERSLEGYSPLQKNWTQLRDQNDNSNILIPRTLLLKVGSGGQECQQLLRKSSGPGPVCWIRVCGLTISPRDSNEGFRGIQILWILR